MKSLPVIVTPIYRPYVTEHEEISLRQLRKYLSNYTRIIAHPSACELPRTFCDFETVRFPDEYFRSIQSYNRLMLSDEFYGAFSEYTHILIYQLDCLVFGDTLTEWCERGYDYIGAPWSRSQAKVSQVGNGGLSLRRVAKFREVLRSGRLSANLRLNLQWHSRFSIPAVDRLARIARLATSNSVQHHIRRTTVNEDAFWSWHARRFTSSFAIPDAREAAAFSIETEPEYWYEVNGRRLPFGCHAWERYGYDFWLSKLNT